jgi:hypothetical protein
MDTLVRDYLPQDTVEICKQRNKAVKRIHRGMKTKNWDQLEPQLDLFRNNVIPMDEVTYVTLLFGYLISPRYTLDIAEGLVDHINSVEYIHPVLKRMIGSHVKCLRQLETFDASPNHTSLVKSLVPFLEIATEIRRLRLLSFRVSMGERVRSGDVILQGSRGDDDYDFMDELEDID